MGFENISVKEIAKNVQKIIPSKIVKKDKNDPRSYRMNSDKLIKVGFKRKFNNLNAIKDLKKKFDEGFKPSIQNWNLKLLLKKKVITKYNA